ncbi:hypothetical protein L195_g046868, partial [Trifolium pratense]
REKNVNRELALVFTLLIRKTEYFETIKYTDKLIIRATHEGNID